MDQKGRTAPHLWWRIALAAAAALALGVLWKQLDSTAEWSLAITATLLVVAVAALVPWLWSSPPFIAAYTLMIGIVGVSAALLAAHLYPEQVLGQHFVQGPTPTSQPTPTNPTSTPPSPSNPAAAMDAVFPLCDNVTASDPDGDGWGWENNKSCVVPGSKVEARYPYCLDASSDPDGDGWGWENNKSCIVRNGKADPARSTPASPSPLGSPQ